MARPYYIDTLSIVEELMKAGSDEKLAKAHARIFYEQMENARREREQELEAKQLATKGDLQRLEVKLIYWIVGFIVGSMLALAGLMITLFQIYK